MQTRIAQPADLMPIVSILNQAIAASATAHREPIAVTGRNEWFGAHDPETRPVIVVEIRNQVVGWGSLSDYRPGRAGTRRCAEISYFVDEAYRRRGVGSTLLTELLARCPRAEIRTLIAILVGTNVASIALLEKFGFAEWGRLPAVVELGTVDLRIPIIVDGISAIGSATVNTDENGLDHVYYGRRLTEPTGTPATLQKGSR